MIGNEPTKALSSARSLFNTSCEENIVACTGTLCVVMKINYLELQLKVHKKRGGDWVHRNEGGGSW